MYIYRDNAHTYIHTYIDTYIHSYIHRYRFRYEDTYLYILRTCLYVVHSDLLGGCGVASGFVSHLPKARNTEPQQVSREGFRVGVQGFRV